MYGLDYLTPSQVARSLGVTPQGVRAWIYAGQIRATRIGHRWRISRDEVRRFVEEGSAQPSSQASALATQTEAADAQTSAA